MLARRAQLRHDKYFSFAPLPTPHAPFPELYIGLSYSH